MILQKSIEWLNVGTRTKGMLKWKVEGHCKGDKLMLEEILNWNLCKKGHCMEEEGNGVSELFELYFLLLI